MHKSLDEFEFLCLHLFTVAIDLILFKLVDNEENAYILKKSYQISSVACMYVPSMCMSQKHQCNQ